ncbi:hypothetical protein LCGC14_1548290 [marine sediment metagenome]|uniref:Uncharacterized protein n=1 Tax=marine sediment metagenome TaxID=412755 RepID=A0A0F9L728_9ZZZZ
MTREEELNRIIAIAHDELSTIDVKKKLKENTKLIGKCFKYRNSYSAPEEESDYWWLYYKVISVNRHGICMAMRFQTDKHGRIEIEKERYFVLSDRYIKITEEEFEDAWDNLLLTINFLKCFAINLKEE